MTSIGIVAMELYFPSTFVDLKDEEVKDGCPGKYTLGLGQQRMVYARSDEDAISMALTVVHRIKHRISADSRLEKLKISCIEVGSESNPDKAKSIKSHLTALFDSYNIDGADSVAACYGGTAALIKAFAWLLIRGINPHCIADDAALVVMSDIADYGEMSSKATGGAGAIAVLLAKNAPLVLQEESIFDSSSTFSRNAWDFWRPSNSPYPQVNGKESIKCYMEALEYCYKQRQEYWQSCDVFIFHTPFARLAEKASEFIGQNPKLHIFQKSLTLARNVGNIYCGSLYMALTSLLEDGIPKCINKIGLFSYGSGLCAKMFSIAIDHDAAPISITQWQNLFKRGNSENERDIYILAHFDNTGRRSYKRR